jgi:hypothetical protein
MLKYIKLQNVGPAPKMELEFGKRLNIFTGDNGLGKSFLLDICWWALTRKWPAEVNDKLSAGLMARPHQSAKAEIEFILTTKNKSITFSSTFDRANQTWKGRQGRPYSPGLVIYAMADGSFAAWDPARNYWRKKGNIDIQDRPPAYVFSPPEIWNTLYNEEDSASASIPLCNGLILDWGGWQKEKGEAFATLSAVLEALSPSESEKIEAGELTRISLNDSRDIPTLLMPYGQDVPVLHASAGVRRIIALAYLLVWTWEEHLKACKFLGQKPTSEVIFLIDEIEAHLHPQWQRKIIGALLAAVEKLAPRAKVQVITATHSPLILASLEPLFDPEQDAWFDLDLVRDNRRPHVTLTRREFELHGDVCNWLTSEAFDLPSARSLEAEKLLNEASRLLEKDQIKPAEVRKMYDRLVNQLSPQDSFLFRWRAIVEKKGWLK